MKVQNLYSTIIEKIFTSKYVPGLREVEFEREDIIRVADRLKVRLPKNLGDLVYSFRYRTELPMKISSKAGKGEIWIIRGVGKAKYRFVLTRDIQLLPNVSLSITKVPDSTPGVIAKYALTDEQALLAIVRYNRLIDIFTGVTCYALQSHLRTTVPGLGQVETDEMYVGVDKRGIHYVFPVQAKSGRDKLSVVQVEQDMALCVSKFPSLICRPIGAQFMEGNVIALFELEKQKNEVRVSSEKHYKLVAPEEVTEADLISYRDRTTG